MGLREENESLKRRLFMTEIIQTIDTSLHIQVSNL